MLARRLKIKLPDVPPTVTNRVADWCVQEFQVSRRRYLMCCNTASLFPVVAEARGVNDEAALITRLTAALHQSFAGTKLTGRYRRWIVPELGATQWAPIPDRSILGSINDMINMACSYLENHGYSPVVLSRHLAESPMSMLGMNSPERVFPKLRG